MTISRALVIAVAMGSLFGTLAVADDSPPKEKMVSGMSIVGNDEAPKALVIVPWKSSQLGGALELAHSADVGPQPVDREVFVRALSYYEIRAGLSAEAATGPANQLD